jgi:hypothetical protein
LLLGVKGRFPTLPGLGIQTSDLSVTAPTLLTARLPAVPTTDRHSIEVDRLGFSQLLRCSDISPQSPLGFRKSKLFNSLTKIKSCLVDTRAFPFTSPLILQEKDDRILQNPTSTWQCIISYRSIVILIHILYFSLQSQSLLQLKWSFPTVL